MVNSLVNMLCSDTSHMAFLFVWQKSGVTRRHGFDLNVDIAGAELEGRPYIGMDERGPKLLAGEYDFLSGLHHEPYVYRGRGDKRFVYLAQAQNDWDDRIISSPDIHTARDLEGKKFVATAPAPCVLGNLKHSLEVAGADISKIDFILASGPRNDRPVQAIEALVNGEVAAIGVDIPYDLRAEKLGMKRLDVPSIPVIHNATICANREWVVQNEDTTLAVLRSMIDAIHFFKTQKSRVCEILDAHLAPLIGLKGDDEIEHLQRGWAKLLSPKPYPHPLAVWNVYNLDVAHDPEINHIGPFEIWDTGYLRAIDDAGYVEELYGGAKESANPKVNPAI